MIETVEIVNFCKQVNNAHEKMSLKTSPFFM